jgi:hypothetical protein
MAAAASVAPRPRPIREAALLRAALGRLLRPCSLPAAPPPCAELSAVARPPAQKHPQKPAPPATLPFSPSKVSKTPKSPRSPLPPAQTNRVPRPPEPLIPPATVFSNRWLLSSVLNQRQEMKWQSCRLAPGESCKFCPFLLCLAKFPQNPQDLLDPCNQIHPKHLCRSNPNLLSFHEHYWLCLGILVC